MSDLISREAAIDAMDTWDKFGCDTNGKLVRCNDDKHYIPYVHYEDMVHTIKNLPSAEPRWISATERLPEKGEEGSDEVSVTCDNGRKHYFVTTGILLKGDWVNVVDNYYLPCEVVAWMPLPEPHHPKEGRE